MNRPRLAFEGRRAVVLVAALALVIASACGSNQLSPTLQTGGLTSVAPPETGTPATSPDATETASADVPTPTPAATTAPGATAPLPIVKVGLTKVVAGLGQSIGVVSAGDSRLFVIVQTGRILIVDGGAVKGTFLNVAARLSCCGERGLIGLAFHPRYASNGLFYIRYTAPNGDVRISQFHVSSDPNAADPASEKILITIPHRTFANHNGGTIAFGPDGYLYIGTGDGGSGGDPSNNGQNLKVLLGKMLRIDVDDASAGLNYAIPAANPFAGKAGYRGEIWAYGLRNPYGFSFDRRTGDLWIADVGQNLWEEVDRATAASGGGRGANFGWSVMEGRHCYKPASRCSAAGKVVPIAEYTHGSHDSVGCSIIGGFVYRGTARPDLEGRYFFGDYCSGKIWDLAAAGPDSQTPQPLLSSGLKITGWGQGTDGELYVTATNGGLYRLT